MIVRRRGDEFEVAAPAKLNLFLEILGKRPDGFHEIETVMTPVTLFDTLSLTVSDSDQIELECELTADAASPGAGSAGSPRDSARISATSLPTGADNIVVRALQTLRRDAGVALGARVRLTKRIPLAAGMAGGSTDAAAALAAGNAAWDLGYDAARLAAIAATLGSDIPFFFYRSPALCRGRGEQVESVAAGTPLDFVVVAPPVGLSTADVYRACQPATEPKTAERLVDAWRRGDKTAVAESLHNRLQPAAAGLCDWIERLGRELDRFACLGHQMSGSGTSYFAVCRGPREARATAAALAGRGLGRTFAVRSCMAA